MGTVRKVTKGRDALGREVELFSKDLSNPGLILLPRNTEPTPKVFENNRVGPVLLFNTAFLQGGNDEQI